MKKKHDGDDSDADHNDHDNVIRNNNSSEAYTQKQDAEEGEEK